MVVLIAGKVNIEKVNIQTPNAPNPHREDPRIQAPPVEGRHAWYSQQECDIARTPQRSGGTDYQDYLQCQVSRLYKTITDI